MKAAGNDPPHAAGASGAGDATGSAALTMTLHRVTQQARTSQPAHGSRAQGEYLLIIEPASSFRVDLPDKGSLILGRAPDAQIQLKDPAASRHHARLDLDEGHVRLTDLGSYNGTRVNGEALRPSGLLTAGDVVTICDSVVLLRRQEPQGLVRTVHPMLLPLRERLEEEIERARLLGGSLVLALVQALPRPGDDPDSRGGKAGALGELCDGLSRVLRPSDMAAQATPRRLAVLLLDCDEAAASGRVQSLLPGTWAQAGLASFPDDAQDPDGLFDAATFAVEGAAPGSVRTARHAVDRFSVAGSEVLIADPAMRKLYGLLERLAKSELPVLIHGETGVGKELAAATLHDRSPRRQGRLVTVNCAALSETLAESELFGHERGAFTGAVATKVGLFEAASGGTLFLDELGELSLSLQAKLLRVLENKKVTRVGDTKERAIDVRIVAATNRKLDEEVKAGRFRQDLYFRLASAVVLMPPLRERRREIALLARLFVAQAAARLGQAVPLLAPAALDALQAHGWPGNLRELKNAMEYAVAVAVDDTIEPENLPTSVVSVTPQAVSPNTLQQPLAQLARAVLRVATGDKLEAIQEVLVQEALTLAEGNKSAAARLLGVHRKVIERRVTKE